MARPAKKTQRNNQNDNDPPRTDEVQDDTQARQRPMEPMEPSSSGKQKESKIT